MALELVGKLDSIDSDQLGPILTLRAALLS